MDEKEFKKEFLKGIRELKEDLVGVGDGERSLKLSLNGLLRGIKAINGKIIHW